MVATDIANSYTLDKTGSFDVRSATRFAVTGDLSMVTVKAKSSTLSEGESTTTGNRLSISAFALSAEDRY